MREINKQILLLLLVSFIIIFLWFKNGLLFGAAEDGIPFYSPSRVALLVSSPWLRDGTGYLIPTIIPQYPLMLFAKYMDAVFPKNVTQALVFWFIIFSGLTGAYLLTKKLTGRRLIALLASLFYFFNLYSMSQVWLRAIYGLMFGWAFLPLFLFLWIKLLEGEKIIHWLGIFLVLQVVFSYSYSMPNNVFVFWVPAGLYLLTKVFKERKNRKKVVRLILISFVTGILWLLTNIWWIYPLIKLAGNSYVMKTSVNLNLESLKGVSTSFPVSQIVQLRQKFFFNTANNKETPWGTFYDSPLTFFVSTIGFLIVLWGLIRFRKNKYFSFLFLLFLIALFISKGTNSPFGLQFYEWLFANFPFTEMFRNSYEKFGLVFLLPYAIFFGTGIFAISSRFRKRNLKALFYLLIFATFFVYLTHPMWNGEYVFEKYFWIKVPKYYEEANQFLNKDTSDSRILVLPTLPFHGVRYNWGYRGDEPSRYIFDKVPIAKKTLGYAASKYDQLSKSFKEKPEDINQHLDQLNVRYLIINNDIDWQAVGSQSPSDVRKSIENDKNITFIKSFGNLELYEYNSSLPFSLFTRDDGEGQKVNYIKLSPTHYKVEIKNIDEPYKLIFRETFDNLWEARIKDKKISEHLLVYGFANSWKIDKTGDYEIDIVLKVWPWD